MLAWKKGRHSWSLSLSIAHRNSKKFTFAFLSSVNLRGKLLYFSSCLSLHWKCRCVLRIFQSRCPLVGKNLSIAGKNWYDTSCCALSEAEACELQVQVAWFPGPSRVRFHRCLLGASEVVHERCQDVSGGISPDSCQWADPPGSWPDSDGLRKRWNLCMDFLPRKNATRWTQQCHKVSLELSNTGHWILQILGLALEDIQVSELSFAANFFHIWIRGRQFIRTFVELLCQAVGGCLGVSVAMSIQTVHLKSFLGQFRSGLHM